MKLIGEKYKIIDSLGKGGNGQVYLAENTMLNIKWAIKKIDKKQTIDYTTEVNILKKLKHKYLPVLFDVIEDEEYIYLIEEYIEGNTLRKIIENNKVMSEDKVIEVVKKICEVLDYLHSFKPNPIIYRDIKPSNIMILNNGDIKLLDFGIAREFKESKSEDTVLIGTKGYAAPEQYGGYQTDERSDIYSLGVTIHHMLTGKKPYIHPYEFLPVKKFNNKISKKMQIIINKCLELDPGKRFQSAKELLEYLNENNHSYNKRSNKKELNVFKQKNISIFDNAEFTCELAFVAASLGVKVLIIDLCYFSNIVDIFFEENNQKMLGINDFLNKDTISCYKDLENYMYKLEGLELYILSNNYSTNYLDTNVQLDNLKKLLSQFHLSFLVVNKTLENPIIKELLELCDYTLFPQKSDYESANVFNAVKGYLYRNCLINKEKLKYIAYEYKEGINVPLEDVRRLIGKENFGGYISYEKKRELSRNLCNKIILTKKAQKEYLKILSYLKVVK